MSYGTTSFLSTPSFTLGYAFTTTSALRVSQLGVFDLSGDGLADSHAVGLFDSRGQMLASTTIAGGTAAALSGEFRYASIAPLTLAGHETYFLGALYTSNADDYVTTPTSITGTLGLTYLHGTFGSQGDGSATLTAPLTAAVDRFSNDPVNYFGPNMTVSAVPLPSTFPLFGLALLGFGAVGCGSRKRLA